MTGDLDAAGAVRLAEHLADCSDCRRHEQALLRKVELLRATRLPGLSADFKSRLFQRLGMPAPRRQAAGIRGRLPVFALAAACLCALLIAPAALRVWEGLSPRDFAEREADPVGDLEQDRLAEYFLNDALYDSRVPTELRVYSNAAVSHAMMAALKSGLPMKGGSKSAPSKAGPGSGEMEPWLPPAGELLVIVKVSRADRDAVDARLRRALVGENHETKLRIEYRFPPEIRWRWLFAALALELAIRLLLYFSNRRLRLASSAAIWIFGWLNLPLMFGRFYFMQRSKRRDSEPV
ncbi:MAG: hypothetical protein NXI24_22970 [bacterium]|nr:hypothetical protein [bacterium]